MVRFLRGVFACVAAMLTIASGPAVARPYTVDDLVDAEAFGQILVAPGGRWLIVERLVGPDRLSEFDERAMPVLRSRLFYVDLTAPGTARPLLPQSERGGTIVLGFSPHGSRVAIARLTGETWQLGVATLASGEVRWFAVSPDYYPFRSTLGWASERSLLVIAQRDGALPWKLTANRRDLDHLTRAWATMRRGDAPTVTPVGSGRYLSVTAPSTQTDLVRLDTESGATQRLATGTLQSIVVAPDGRHVALVAEGGAILQQPLGRLETGSEARHSDLTVIDISSGQSWRPCPGCDVPYRPPVWAPSGSQLLFFAKRGGEPWTEGAAEIADIQRHRITALPGSFRAAVQTPFGDYPSVGMAWSAATPLLFGRPTGARRDDWYAFTNDQRPRALSAGLQNVSPDVILARNGAPVMRAAGGTWQLGPTSRRPALAGMEQIAKQPFAISGGTEAAERSIFGWRRVAHGIEVATGSGGRVDIVAGGNAPRPVATSAAVNAAVVVATDPHGRSALVVHRPGRRPVEIMRINDRLGDIEESVPIALHHRLPDGRQATSWLYLPADLPERVPLVVIPYAGLAFGSDRPRGVGAGDGAPYTSVPALRGQGYAVLLPSMPDLPASDAGFDLAGQVLSAVDAAVATGMIDGDRLAIWGHSFGGYTAAVIATQTRRFKAIIASNGIYDLATFPGTFTPQTRLDPGDYQGMLYWAGWTESGQPHLGGPPWTLPARYIASSPLYRADRIDTPMLIIAGERDFVPLQQSEQLFSALYRQGKDAVLLSYWGEEHNMVSPANLRDSYSRIFAWLRAHLGTP